MPVPKALELSEFALLAVPKRYCQAIGHIILTNSIRPDAISDIAAADRVRFIGISVVLLPMALESSAKAWFIRADRIAVIRNSMIVITYSIGILTAGVIIYAGNSRIGPGSIRKTAAA